MTTTALPTETDVIAAAQRIRPYVRRTPVLDVDVDGQRVVFKLEHLQLTGSFKVRGALNALLLGPRPSLVITASGGNHGLAVATAAALLDLPAYDDATVIAGQATVAAEIVADRPEVDSLVIAVGGGGLAAGAVIGGGGRPILAVEPDGCCCLHDALAAGEPVDTAVTSVAASALGASRIGALPFELLRGSRSGLVSDAELLAARDRLWEEFRLAVEPAAAVPFAALLSGQVSGALPCLVLCGANTDWTPTD